MLQGEHSAILSTCIKLPNDLKPFVLSIFEWPLKAGFTVPEYSAALYNTLSYNMDLIITWSCVFFFYHGILQRNYRKIVRL